MLVMSEICQPLQVKAERLKILAFFRIQLREMAIADNGNQLIFGFFVANYPPVGGSRQFCDFVKNRG